MSTEKIAVQRKPRFWQLAPFIVFVGLFSTLHLLFAQAPTAAKSGFALFSCLVAVIFSLATFTTATPFNEKVAVFVRGTAHPTIIYMAYIFIISSVFTHLLTLNGGVQAAVNVGLSLIPAWALLPGLFITVSLFALTIGSSMGSIAAFMPIALGFSAQLGINPSLIAGLVVGGSMLGDNLSVISDTTIAAAQTTGCKMTDKFKANGLLVLPAFIMAVAILFYLNATTALASDAMLTSTGGIDVIKIIPYLLVFAVALAGVDVLAVLVLGTLSAAAIGIWQGAFTFLEATSYLFEGFYSQPGMVNVLILVMLIAGLANIIEHNGGITYLLEKWHPRIQSARSAQISIALLAFLVNAAIAINTVAILITGPVAKKIGDSFGIPAPRVASLLDIFACVCQGLLPYTPQLLLASAMAGVSSVSLLPYLHYQYLIGAVALVSVLWHAPTPRSS